MTPLPTPPSTLRPETFASEMDTYLDALTLHQAELNALGSALSLGLSSTSATSIAFGLGEKTFTTDTGKGYVAGMDLVIASTATPSDRMLATVTSYNGTTGSLVVNVYKAVPTGTFAAWAISFTALDPDTFVMPDSVQVLTNKTMQAAKEVHVTLAANNIDLSLGSFFSKTLTIAATLTLTNTPAANSVATFVLNLTDGGSAAITWWSGIKWGSGTAPTLTTTGRDVLAFFTLDGGTTWTGVLVKKDVR